MLKKGLDVDNAHFTLLYRLPYNDLNPDVTAKFESNIFSITRQVYFSSVDHKSVDMVVFQSNARFSVDPRLSALLGKSYTSSECVLRELVDNAWDCPPLQGSIVTKRQTQRV